MDNIINTWCSFLHESGDEIKDGISRLNKQMGRNYGYSKLSEWRIGLRHTPQEALRIMVSESLEYAIKETTRDGKTDFAALAIAILPPKRKE
jgi:hypothetical protein